MIPDAEAATGPVWATDDDPRVTRLGRILRKTRLDEVPQLLNVVRGEMRLVGPRPERPEFVTRLAETIPYYEERHRVKPGLTGWAQLNYPYGASEQDAAEKLQYDLYYVKNHSLLLDMLVLMQTAEVVFPVRSHPVVDLDGFIPVIRRRLGEAGAVAGPFRRGLFKQPVG